MERLLQDLRFGARLLWKDRGFTFTALLTLAVCIGANTAIFAVVNSVLLRPLPVPGSEQLVSIYNSYPGAGITRASTGVPDYFDRLEQTDVFEELALYQTRGVTLGADGADPQRLSAMAVTPSLFRLLRAQPVRGRIFDEAEGEYGEHRKAVISYGLWQQHFAGSDAAVSSTLRLNGEQHTVVGIMPAGFHFMDPEVRVWIPLWFTDAQKSDEARHDNSWTMVGRLKPGATVAQAQQQIDAINARNLERLPVMREVLINAGFTAVVAPLQDEMVRDAKATLFLLWAGVVVVLIIGTVNLANLVLVRSSGRMKELATRHALGAGMPALVRQLTTEAVMLTVAGGVAGGLLGYWGLGMLTTQGLEHLPRAAEIRMDGAAVAFTAGLALLLGVALGITPLFALRQGSLRQAFREEGRSGTSGRHVRTLRRLLVASQVAFAFVLLIGAGLLLASFARVLAVDPGFRPAGLLTARLAPPPARYPMGAELRAFTTRFLERVRALPGVEHAALTSSMPFGGQLQRQRHPGRGLSDGAGRVGRLALSRRSERRLPGGARRAAAGGADVHRVRYGGLAPRRRRGRAAGEALLGGPRPDRPPDVQPRHARGRRDAGAERPLVYGRRRGGRDEDGQPGQRSRPSRRVLLPPPPGAGTQPGPGRADER
jgi:predicted permease